MTKEDIVNAKAVLDAHVPKQSKEYDTLLKALNQMKTGTGTISKNCENCGHELDVDYCEIFAEQHGTCENYSNWTPKDNETKASEITDHEGHTSDIPQEAVECIIDELCSYFHHDTYVIKDILCDRNEFRKWLDRLKWHVKKCEELGREVDEFRRCSSPKVADKDALIAVLTELRDASSDISRFTSIDKNEVHLQLEEALKLAELSDKTNNMTSSHGESDIYKGCLGLMESLKGHFYEWLDYIGVDVTELSEEEQFSVRFYPTEIVRRLFLEYTRHSGGTSCHMKCKELGIDSGEEVYFDFSDELAEPEDRTDREDD